MTKKEQTPREQMADYLRERFSKGERVVPLADAISYLEDNLPDEPSDAAHVASLCVGDFGDITIENTMVNAEVSVRTLSKSWLTIKEYVPGGANAEKLKAELEAARAQLEPLTAKITRLEEELEQSRRDGATWLDKATQKDRFERDVREFVRLVKSRAADLEGRMTS